MNIGTFGTIDIDVLELLDFNISYDYGFTEIDKVSGTSVIQETSNSVTKIDIRLKFYTDNYLNWLTEASSKSLNTLTIGSYNYGNFYIKSIGHSIKCLAPKTIDLTVSLWQVI